MQIEEGPVRIACGFSLMVNTKDESEIQPDVASVNLNVAVPVPSAVTKPELSMEAKVG